MAVDHSTMHRSVLKYAPQLEEAFHPRKRPVWISWRMDETYLKVKGHRYYCYGAVDTSGRTIDLLLMEHRDKQAAPRVPTKAICRDGVRTRITVDGSRTNAAAIASDNAEHDTTIEVHQVRYLNNLA